MANWNFTAKMGAPVTQYDETANARTAGGAGGVVGKLVGDVLDAKMAQDNTAKSQELIGKYNAKFPPFGAEKRSDDTNKLAQLLLPVDKEMSMKYTAQANAERAQEQKLAMNKKVVEAGNKVATTREEALPEQEITSIDDEINAIEMELKRRANAPDMEGYNPPAIPQIQAPTNRDFSKYTPNFNPWSGNTGSKQDMITGGGNV